MLLDYFGSSFVKYINNSNHEQASTTNDMNLPLPTNMHFYYDTVIDGGSLDHIYNIPQALKTVLFY